MARRKKVLQEIAIDSDNEQTPTVPTPPVDSVAESIEQPPAPPVAESPTTTTTTTTTTTVAEPVAPSVKEIPVQPIVKSQRKKSVATLVVQDQRREALRKANEAKLRKKIEKEIADKERKRQEEERRMEQRVQELVNQQLRRFQQATYAPPQRPLSRRAIVGGSSRRRVNDNEDMYEEDYQMIPEPVTAISDEYYDDEEGDDEIETPMPESTISRARAPLKEVNTYQQKIYSQIFGK